MDPKRAADGGVDAGSVPPAKRGRWDTGSASQDAGVAVALAAAVAAKYAQPVGVRPVTSASGGGAMHVAGLPPGAAAAVAQAAAAALQKLPLTAGAAPVAPRPPSLSLDALEKAKKALQLQKEIQEKLKARLPQLAAKLPVPGSATGAGAAPPLAPSGMPVSVRPLLRPSAPAMLQKQTQGLVSVLPPAPEEPEEEGSFYDPALARGAGARRGERRRRSGFDFVHEGRFQHEAELFRLKAQLGSGAFRKGAPRVSGPLGGPSRLPFGGAAVDANLVPLGTREAVPPREATQALEAEPVPAVEWWDRGVLAHASLAQDVLELPAEVLPQPLAPPGGAKPEADVDMADAGGAGRDKAEGQECTVAEAFTSAFRSGRALANIAAAAAAGQLGPFQLKDARITIYVEHPVPLDPPAEAPPPPPQPLKLTQKELKKLRTQRRLARDKEKQELIRQGLLEPPKPKVRIANLHRVLGTDAALDPTAVEKEVRKQMAERQAAHDDRNLARKLTPAERRDKKMRRLFGTAAVESGAADIGARVGAKGAAAVAAAAAAAASGVDTICSVYRVGRLTDPGHRFKVDANARENHMTGITVISDDFCIVVVEGVEKATRRYLKLMMRRIDWSTAPVAGRSTGHGDGDMGDDDEDEEDMPPNVCTLVWQGTVLRRAFTNFRSETVRSAAAGRHLLEEVGVVHYWDAAAGAIEGESVPYTL